MRIPYLGIVLIWILAAGVLSARLWCYRRQIRHIRGELALLKDSDTNGLLTSCGAVGGTAEMIAEINALLVQDRETRRQLIKENTAYRESITSISHDIRTPLTSAKGYVQMLQRPDLTGEKRAEYLEAVERRLDNLTDMLNRLFEYARIEAGEAESEPEEFNAVNLFAETISMFYEDFCRKGCEPEVLLEKEPCKIRADRQAFVRIVENLIRNALVHGTGGFRLSAGKESGQAIIRVSNLTDSVGPQDMDKIFDRFYTTDRSRSRRTTGLGLAIVKRLALLSGGSANAYLEGQRFTIEVRFPLLEETVDCAEEI
ncbi:MAG: HAMP domain-containing histidine kinase [Roseburia sp.]|nr:HAMP domain-containing histidine kinase [Roseburia sp.]